MSQYFPKPFKNFGGNINVKVDLSNYATKSDIKNISHVDTSSFPLKTNLASLKTEVDKLDNDKLLPVPVDLSKLSNVVKSDVVKKLSELGKENEELEDKIIKDGKTKITKINIPPKQKMEHTYSISCKKYTGNSHIVSKTINNEANS